MKRAQIRSLCNRFMFASVKFTFQRGALFFVTLHFPIQIAFYKIELMHQKWALGRNKVEHFMRMIKFQI